MTSDDKTKGYDIPLGAEFFDKVIEDGEEKLVLNAAKLISRANELWGNEGWSSETTIEQLKYPPVKKGITAVLATSTCTINGSGGNTHKCTATSLAKGDDLHRNIEEATKKAKEDALVEAMSRFGEGLGLCGQDSEYIEQVKAMEVPKRLKFDPDRVVHHIHYDPTNTQKRPAALIPATPEPVNKKTNTQQGDSDQGSGGRGNTARRGTGRRGNTGGRRGNTARRGNKGGEQSSTSSASKSTSTPSSTSPSESTSTPSSTSPSESISTPSSSSASDPVTTPSSTSSSEPTIASSSSSSSSAFKKPAYTQTKLPF